MFDEVRLFRCHEITVAIAQERYVGQWYRRWSRAQKDTPAAEELLPVEVEAIAPVRTLAEKVALLHHAATAALNGDARSLEKAGRDFSDVARLLNKAGVQAALARPESSMEILVADVDEWSTRSGWPFTPRPAEGYKIGSAFDSPGALREIAEKSYTDSTSLILGQVQKFRRVS